jgi:hypothetical protein
MSNRVKYPRTPHLPFSQGRTDDDKVLSSIDHFFGQEVVVTLKMDGENTTLLRDGFHARSLDSRHHPSRDLLAAFHAGVAYSIPEGWRVCGENLYARHSIAYDSLPAYFMGFSVWDETNTALSWDDTVSHLYALGIVPVRVLFRGAFDEKTLKNMVKTWDSENDEGFVVRLSRAIPYDEFPLSYAKWVRAKHVQTDKHWMHAKVVPNGLAAR